MDDLRKEYTGASLTLESVDVNPIEQFRVWFGEVKDEEAMANACSLATADTDGKPSARIVLVKNFDESGFMFFTNYESQKGQELQENNRCEMCFWWPTAHRQVRIFGESQWATSEQSDQYFENRPRGSNESAIASPQSEPVSLQALRQRLKDVQENGELTRPAHWGGVLVKPTRMEFWQGQQDRLHDRIVYTLSDGVWRTARLAP